MATLKERYQKALDDAKALNIEVSTKAETEKRLLSDDEKKGLDESITLVKGLKQQIDGQAALDEFEDAPGTETDDDEAKAAKAGKPSDKGEAKSLGEQFTESAEFKAALAGGGANAIKRMAAVELKTTLTEGSGSGGKLIQPQVLPGIQELLFKRLTVADLIPSGQADGNTIRYLKETTFTNSAATVAEGGTKPESALVFDLVDEPVQKIAHWLPVSDEMLEDVSAIRSFIDARLALGVQLTEEDQLLNGSGTPPDLTGILNRSSLATTQARGSDSNVDAILKQIVNIQSTAFLDPDAVVINPANMQTIWLSKDANGMYYAGGPFATPSVYTIWGRRAVVTPSIAANTALVGAFRQAAQVFRKGGIQIAATNSHASFFTSNLTAIRAEERLALAVYRPGGFGKVTGLS